LPIFKNNNNLSGGSFKDKIRTVKTFLEFNDIELSPKKIQSKGKVSEICIKT